MTAIKAPGNRSSSFGRACGDYTLTEIGAEWRAGIGDVALSIHDEWGPFAKSKIAGAS